MTSVIANKAIYKTIYRRLPSGTATVELTNKNNEVTTISANRYSDNIVYYIPSTYMTATNLPATAVFKINGVAVDTETYSLIASGSSSGDLTPITDRLEDIEGSSLVKDKTYTSAGTTPGFHLNLNLGYDTNNPELPEPVMVKVNNSSGVLDKSFWLNESGLPRASAIRKEEPALKLHSFSDTSTVPVIEVRGKWSTGAVRRWGISGQGYPLLGVNQIIGAHTIILTAAAAVPAGLPAGTVIVRTA